MSVLPPNSGELLKFFERSADSEVERAIQGMYAFKSEPADNLLYWLIWEYGLESVLPYSTNLRSLLKNGLNWQRIRGTPASLTMACGWLGLDGTTIEQASPGRHFYEYQLNPASIPGDSLLAKLVHIARLSSPARSRLARVYHGYDVRALHLSTHPFGHSLSDDSGTQFNNGDSGFVKISFGRRHRYQARLSTVDARFSLQRTMTQQASASFIVRLGEYLLGNRLRDHFIGGVRHRNYRSLGVELQGRAWSGDWEAKAWQQRDYMVASHQLRRYRQVHHQHGVIVAVYEHGRSELHQSRSQTLREVTPLSFTLDKQHKQSHHLLASCLPDPFIADVQHQSFRSLDFKLQGRAWLGGWEAKAWQRLDYVVASHQSSCYRQGVIIALYEHGHSELHQSRSQTLNEVTPLSFTLDKQHERSHYLLASCLLDPFIADVQHKSFCSLDFKLQDRAWLGGWEARSWRQRDYVVASHGLQSYQQEQQPQEWHRHHGIAALYEDGQGELHQSRSHALSDMTPQALILDKQHQRRHTLMGPLTGQTWLGYWASLSWQNTPYSMASVSHSATSF